MRNAMSWIKKNSLRDLVVIALVSILLFGLINVAFVYFSPAVVKLMPSNFVRNISPCYRTLFHHRDGSLERVNYVFGDSYSEGSGDEFLGNDEEYGIFNKLEDSGSTELIFGRGGYGNIGTLVEFEKCYPLLEKYTSIDTSLTERYSVTFVFYEGNDLNNNLVEEGRDVNEVKYKLRFFLPLFEFAYNEMRGVVRSAYRKIKSWIVPSASSPDRELPLTSSGIQIGLYPQSAATELSIAELTMSLSIVSSVLEQIHERLPDAENYTLLYLPAVASSYSFENELRVQSYSGRNFFLTTNDFNRQRHQTIVKHLRQQISNMRWFMCDITPGILVQTEQGIPVHGPRDWKHFNKIGYRIVANAYMECLNESKGVN
jgi:hypothetical protein